MKKLPSGNKMGHFPKKPPRCLSDVATVILWSPSHKKGGVSGRKSGGAWEKPLQKTEKEHFTRSFPRSKIIMFTFQKKIVSLQIQTPLIKIINTMKINPKYKVRKMANEYIILMQGADATDVSKVISLNSSSLLLWNELKDRDFELQDVTHVLTSHYQVDEAQAQADAQEWIDKLSQLHILA